MDIAGYANRGPLLRTASCVFVKRKPNGLTAIAAKPFAPRYAPKSHENNKLTHNIKNLVLSGSSILKRRVSK